MVHLTINHLQMLCAIRDSATLGAAADRLGITQSALSHRIREAERRLNIVLFDRAGPRSRPTVAADILTETAESILDQLQIAERAAVASTQGIRHVVRVTVCDYNSYHWLPGFLDWFRADQPEIEIEIEPNGTANALRRLSQKQLDIVIFPDASEPELGRDDVLLEDQLVVAVWPGHRFTQKRFVTARDFGTETYLTYSLEGRPGFESELLWSRENMMPLRKRNLGSVDAVCELVKAQAGVSVLSRWGIQRELAARTLAAIQAGKTGVPIVWRALTASDLPPAAPANLTAAALKRWFRSSEPDGTPEDQYRALGSGRIANRSQ